MTDTVIVGLLSLVGTLGGSFGGILAANKLVNYRLTKLEEKVEKHNNIIERTYRLEEDEKIVKEKIKVINHRIEDLEEYHK